MKMLSWNVNGIRAVLKKGFMDFARDCGADVICIQETKAQPDQVDIDLPGYQQYWNSAERKGYAGTLVFSRAEPIGVVNGLGIGKHDDEGRMITLEYPDFYLVTVYTPNAQRGLARLDYRTKEWDVDFLKKMKKLQRKKPVVFCGDLNVAHKEIDLANPKSNVKNAGFTPEERKSFDNIVAAGFIDTFREFNQEPGHYTWWSMMRNARDKNIGWRLDYFCISPALRGRLKSSEILPDVMGSDHCPVMMDIG